MTLEQALEGLLSTMDGQLYYTVTLRIKFLYYNYAMQSVAFHEDCNFTYILYYIQTTFDKPLIIFNDHHFILFRVCPMWVSWSCIALLLNSYTKRYFF